MEELNRKIQNLKHKHQKNNIIVEATVPTGLESMAVNEIVENGITSKDQVCFISGRVYFTIPIESFEKVKVLRSIDNINLVVDLIPNLKFSNKKEDDLEEIVTLLDKTDILSSVKQWASISEYKGNVEPNKEQHDEARIKQDKIFNSKIENNENNHENDEYTHNILKYRVTCDRIGKNHSFSSNEAAYRFGGEVNNKFLWIVALSDWDLNIFLRIKNNDALICLKVTVRSLHRRCLVDFGPTSLRPTISYGMLALAKLSPGDHILDPLCGSGSIPIECMYAFPNVIVNCGDIHHRAIDRTLINISAQKTKLPKPDLFAWNAAHLPFADHSLDAIVSDLPFGKRSGSKKNNAQLYKKLTTEFARVLKINTGRIVLLTKDSPHLYKALDYRKPESCWNITYITNVNVGALKCALIVALRNDIQNI